MADQDTSPKPETESQDQQVAQPEGNDAQNTQGQDEGNQLPSFATQLPKDYRHVAEGYDSMAAFMAAASEAFNAQQNAVVKPGDGATQEQWDEYWKAVGRPDSPDGYELAPPEGAEVDQELAKEFRQKAHEAGLNSEQAKELFDWYFSTATQRQQLGEQYRQQQKQELETRLKDEWGADYDKNVETIKRAAKRFGDESFAEYVGSSGLGNDYSFVKFMKRVGDAIAGDNLVRGDGTSEPTDQQKLKARYPSHETLGW